MAKKRLIIIPGSCSTRSNWFDQIEHFQELGYEVNFLELEAYKSRTLIESAINLFNRLKMILAKNSNDDIEDLFESTDNQLIIMAHSMGAMLLLKILSEPRLYKSEDAHTYNTISQAKIVFIQVPLKVNRKLLDVLGFFRFWFYPLLFLYRFTVHGVLDRILIYLKKLSKRNNSHPVFKASTLPLNLALMHNSLWGAKVDEFGNLINYYRHWDDFSLESFFADANESGFERAMMNSSESAISRFDLNASLNYYFTVGDPDMFCDSSLIRDFANKLGAQVLELDPGFHSPQHMPWCQDRLHDVIKK